MTTENRTQTEHRAVEAALAVIGVLAATAVLIELDRLRKPAVATETTTVKPDDS